MAHASTADIPVEITQKDEFYAHVHEQLEHLLDDPKASWITATANASALLYHAYQAFPGFGPKAGHAVNWVGFYFVPELLNRNLEKNEDPKELQLGPFNGRPACQMVKLDSAVVGVCAQAFLERKSVLVPDVHSRPGHIACDALTNSEIVLPVIANGKTIGVFDLDCERTNGFDEQDRLGLEKFVEILERLVSRWN